MGLFRLGWRIVASHILKNRSSSANLPAYYIDATGGSDSNDGRSPDTPWQTIAKVNATSFGVGERILFKRGDTWREQLTIPSSGVTGSPIIFGAYSSGDDPVISGADIMLTWTSYSGNTWQKTGITTEPNQVFMDSAQLTEGADRDSLNDHEWVWASDVLYVRDETGDPDGSGVVIEATQRPYCIYNNNSADYITIQNLELSHASVAPVYSDQNNGWIVQGCNVYGGEQFGIQLRGNPSGAGSITGCVVRNNTIGVMYCDNTVQETRAGIWIGGATSPLVRNNAVTVVNAIAINITTGTWDGTGAASDGAIVESNIVTNCESNILIKKTTNSIVRYNYVHDSKGWAIAFNTNSDDAQCYYNLVHDLVVSSDTVMFNGIDINIGCVDGQFFNNTVYGTPKTNLTLEATTSPCDGWIIRNNIFDSTTNPAVSGIDASLHIDASVTEYTFSDNIYNFSLMLAETGFDWRQSYAAWQTFLAGIANGSDTDSADDDPLFTDPSSDDFTLQSGSPCRDDGIDVSLVRDYAGVSVPQETNPAIGAYEYVV